MAKVIRHGNRKIEECPICEAVFSYTQKDLRCYLQLERSGINSESYVRNGRYVECPECGSFVVVSLSSNKEIL